MILGVRISDEAVAQIDRVAKAHGMTRSAWVVRTLTIASLDVSHDALPMVPTGDDEGRGRPSDLERITLRLPKHELDAIAQVGAACGLNRIEWIKRTIRWQLWDKAGSLKLAPVSQYEIGQVRKQVLRIGRNINQAVHAMNAANQPGSTLDLARIADQFLGVCAELKEVLFSTRRTLTSYTSGEVGYWIGAVVREIR